MPQPDYENDLVFPPKDNLSEKRKNNLTEDWKNNKFQSEESFFISVNQSKPKIATIDYDGDFIDIWGSYISSYTNEIEVLAHIPSYDELQRLKEIEEHTWDYDLQAQKLSEALDKNKHLQDFLGNQDKEVENLRDLLKNCKSLCKDMIETNLLYEQGVAICPCKESITDLLTCINAAIGESEE